MVFFLNDRVSLSWPHYIIVGPISWMLLIHLVLVQFFLDWSKAFDRVNHHILLNKLHKYGICRSLLNWFQSYLTNRSQRVQFMGSYSDWAAVHSGVPQGSVLGPLLFNIFAFDLPFCVQSNLRQYADDTVLYRTIKHQDDQLALQNDLQHLHNWCNLNYMELNSGKCKVMAVTRSRNPPSPVYTIGDHVLLKKFI